ncbi:DUF5384 family protein [Escherichia fergusonii]|uniref:DUF5384 family protein n=1 Tax=Escherichia fergusonii TaxID=564 RepID=UPI001CBC4DEA|nr:DUF5384 family protein [Escherichia fergusonii]MBZ4073956.1 DUF5384 family protein [Escherichia fergusonii]MBZ4079515.1 DUF5384 family protein [Escherichia fergusonii]MBZ4087067.1 DUF5384 family protein [Escherichia fergusonii]MBZ4091606.1 DUF5384 family protein [Escherichia fergusonii]MBZ4092513.1 DUF5384 family protein [Escherichia fergusonii]
MKKILIALVAIPFSLSFASSLQNQLAAVAEAEQQGIAEEKRANDAHKENLEREARLEQQRRASVIEAQNRKAAAIAADRKVAREKLESEIKEDKKRDIAYENELRSLEIQKLKLALAREEARVKRENDFIDQELKNKAAQTDILQSNADANRNISEGGKELMKSTGKAKEKEASGFFN